MTDRSSSEKGESLPDASLPGPDRLESLLCALIELKSSISLVEQQHPALGNDLSALCDLVLGHLAVDVHELCKPMEIQNES